MRIAVAENLDSGDRTFRPWRSVRAYFILLIVMTGWLAAVCYLETGQLLESQIAIGVDPLKAARFVSLSILLEMLALVFLAVRSRRSLLASGELRVIGSTLLLSAESTAPLMRDAGELKSVASYPGGANIRLVFSAGQFSLPGQWLPPGWKRTWRGWRSPDGTAAKLSRKTHPLLRALRGLRADLKPKLSGVAPEFLLGVICALIPKIGTLPLYQDLRTMANRPQVNDIAMKGFQEGRYQQACELYQRALPILRHDLYGSQHAGEFLLYCGEPGKAIQAVVGFDGEFLWPGEVDPEVAARIQLARGRYSKAEELLRGRPSYLLYVALADQGRMKEADDVLRRLADKNGLARVLLLRHRGERDQAGKAAAALCANFLQHRPWTPSWLARVFESCILAGGPRRAMEDVRFGPAIRALPGLRVELVQFTRREAPEEAEELQAVITEILLDRKRAA